MLFARWLQKLAATKDGDGSLLDHMMIVYGSNTALIGHLPALASDHGIPAEKAAWLVERYGPRINFASVSPQDVIAVDAIRVGMHRKADYRFLSNVPRRTRY